MNKRKISLLLVGVLLVVCVCIGISYAVWSLNLKQEGTNTIVTGCFNVTFSGINDINLNGAYPISDEEGASLTPYEFTITNTCEDVATYQINLEILNDSTLTELGIMKELLQEKGSTGTPKLLTSNNVVDKTLDNATSSYKLETGLLYKNESKTFELRLWMDENTEAVDSVMNKTLNSKITVVTSYMDIDTTNMMIPMVVNATENDSENLTYTQNNKYDVSDIYFEIQQQPYENAVEIVDFSVNQDRSVLGYYLLNQDQTTYELHIQANGKIKANVDASYYFSTGYNVGSGEYGAYLHGMNNVDTSNAVNMSFMFAGYRENDIDLTFMNTKNARDMSYMFSWTTLSDLDLKSFDTSNVMNMKAMFRFAFQLQNLDLTSFVTTNVMDMSEMFEQTNSLDNLNVNHFDTSNVIDMSSMFSYSGFTNLDLSNWNTGNVKNMSRMFSGLKLTNLNLNNWNTENVIDMSYMFCGLHNLTSLNISDFDILKVTNLRYMFADSDNLIEITYGPKFIYKNNVDVTEMYKNCPGNLPTDASWEGVL